MSKRLNLTPGMVSALKRAASHPEGRVLTNEKTNNALIARGLAEGCYITSQGRLAVKCADV